MTVTRVALVGASGRMGGAIARLAATSGVEIACALSAGDALDAVATARASVVIDFSAPAATLALAPIAARSGVAIVSGTTGLDAAAERALALASADVAVLSEANMSVGVHVLADLVKTAIRALGPAYDVEIVETHHKLKADAPSGTALLLADAARAGRPDLAAFAHGRQGRPGPRTRTEIGLHAIRGGDVIGDHTVLLLGDGERIELTHRATSRDLFAHGALRAAAWIAGKPAGRYRMRDVLEGT